MKFFCARCSAIYAVTDTTIWRCGCGSPLWCDFPVTFRKSDIRGGDLSMWRYDKAFPVKRENLTATFNEGLTPLAALSWQGRNVLVKMDSLMPTGSFKDRGVVMVINFLSGLGVTMITEDSSGNAGASTAAYAALAGMNCSIYIPASASPGKLMQTQLYGAKLHAVTGTREAVAMAAQQNSDGGIYAGHNWHPLFVQGTKSIAYELWEQNGFCAPDAVICSVGNGSTLAGLYTGFSELLASGEINKLPRLYGVQADNCNPIYRASVDLPLDFETKPTIAEGIALYRPTKTEEIVRMSKASGGVMVSVAEEDIVHALLEAGTKGFCIEPTSATAFAGLTQLQNKGILGKNETVVVTVSGNGLKASSQIVELLRKTSGAIL